MFVRLSHQSKRLCARRKLSGVYETRYSICLIGHSRDDSQKLLVGVDAGPTALEHSRAGLLPLHYLCDRLPNSFYIDWL
jgi:hypothetical protein